MKWGANLWVASTIVSALVAPPAHASPARSAASPARSAAVSVLLTQQEPAAPALSTPLLTLGTTDGPPGTATFIAAAGFTPGEIVDLFVGTRQVGDVVSGQTGTITRTVTVPADTVPGAVPVVATGRRSRLTGSSGFTVRTDWTEPGYDAHSLATNSAENALNSSNVGTLEQKFTFPSGSRLGAVAGGRVYVRSSGGVASVTTEGRAPWERFGSYTTAPVPLGRWVVAGTGGRSIRAFDPVNGHTAWTTTLISGAPPVVVERVSVAGDIAYVLTRQFTNTLALTAVSAFGQVLWTAPIGHGLHPELSLGGGVAYVSVSAVDGTETTRLIALRLSDRKALWSWSAGGAQLRRAAYVASSSPGRPVLLAPVQSPVVPADNRPKGPTGLQALDAATGRPLWFDNAESQLQLPGFVSNVAVDGGRAVYAHYNSQEIYHGGGDDVRSLDVATGQVRWSRPTTMTADPVIAGQVVYLPENSKGHWYAVRASDGGVLLDRTDRAVAGEIAIANGRVYVGYGRALGLAGEHAAATAVDDARTGAGLERLQYSDGWQRAFDAGDYYGGAHHATAAGSTATVRFIGVGVRLWWTGGPDHGVVTVGIDGGKPVRLDQYAAAPIRQALSWTSPALSRAEHTVTITATGDRSANSTGTLVSVDRLTVGR